MIITALRPVLLSNDYGPESTLEWVGGRIETWDAALVEIETDDGTTGLGEVAQGIMAAEAVPGICAELETYTLGMPIDDPSSVGDTLRAKTAFWARGGVASGVVGAIEVAAWDAVGKRARQPVFEMIGGARTRVDCYASGGLGTSFAEVAEWATAQYRDGYRIIKFRAMADAATTIDLLDFVDQSVPPDTRIVLDLVQGCASEPWPLNDILAVGTRMESSNAVWLEEPCHADDVPGYAAVRERLSVPISGIESFSNRSDFMRLLEHDGVDIVQPDVSMMGGPRQFQRVVSDAATRGVRTVPHIWGTGVSLMANLHVAIATADISLIERCTIPNPLREALMAEPLRMSTGGRLENPRLPGFGVALTPEVERAFPYQRGRGHVIR